MPIRTEYTVLEEALDVCEGPRQNDYGHPYDNMVVVRRIWSAIAGVDLTIDQCVFMMIGLKQARQMTRHNRDNLVDIAGYSWVLEKCKEREAELAQADSTPA